MKNIKTFIIIVFSILNFSACNPPEPIDQDGTMLWLANGRSYKEVLASVETRIDSTLSKEEYHIYDANGKRYIDGGSQAAIRYGVYALQRAEVLGKADAGLDIHEKPYYEYRILNHWDNLDDTVERGYAGLSMWEWTAKEIPTERIHHYGELCASVGLNGAVLNNVNANPLILDKEHIERVAQIANILREYGITTYLSIKWTSPVTLDGLKSGDPLDPKVRQWWKNKAAEIYTAIPISAASRKGKFRRAGWSARLWPDPRRRRKYACRSSSSLWWNHYVESLRIQPYQQRQGQSGCRRIQIT